jgi:hypothetical protein
MVVGEIGPAFAGDEEVEGVEPAGKFSGGEAALAMEPPKKGRVARDHSRRKVPQVSFLETRVLRLSFLGFSSVACLLLKSGTRHRFTNRTWAPSKERV